MNRRDLLKAVGAPPLLSTLGCAHKMPTLARPDLIRAENDHPGTTEWGLTNPRLDEARARCPWVEGFCSRASIGAGETLEIKVSTDPPAPFTIDIYRMGYYQGTGGRHMATLGPFEGTTQPIPAIGIERLRECQWETSAKLKIPTDWPSGIYVGKLTEAKDKLQSYIVFIVRDDRACDFLFQVSDTNWQAYNEWPNRFSLYRDGKKDPKIHGNDAFWGAGVRVSWDRPYGPYIMHARERIAGGPFLKFDLPMAFWLEKEGYDVSYISGIDTHEDASTLGRARAWLDTGHDEYWSLAAFNNVKNAIQQGLSVGFFSGNVCGGVLGYYPSWDGRPNRAMARVAYYGYADPRGIADGFPETGLMEKGPEECTLLGARTLYPATGISDWVCLDEKHWIHAGTGMKTGDRIPNLIGWEFHGEPADIPGLEVVAQAPVNQYWRKAPVQRAYTATVYPGPKGNVVFNASTIWWSGALAHPPGWKPSDNQDHPLAPDARVQRMTANVLARMRRA